MKIKKSGFTLIELLVVIVILGLLATISAATFSKYFKKARDGVRVAGIAQLTNIVKTDGADKWGDERYIFNLTDDDPANIDDLVDDNDYRLPKASNSICYILGFGTGKETVGDDNQFFIASWGEASSTDKPSETGLIIDGTNAIVDAIKLAKPVKEAFICAEGAPPGGLKVKDVEASGVMTGGVYMYIDADGKLNPFTAAP